MTTLLLLPGLDGTGLVFDPHLTLGTADPMKRFSKNRLTEKEVFTQQIPRDITPKNRLLIAEK